MPVLVNQITGSHWAKQNTIDHEVEASAQRVRNHLLRPLAGSRHLLYGNHWNTVSGQTYEKRCTIGNREAEFLAGVPLKAG